MSACCCHVLLRQRALIAWLLCLVLCSTVPVPAPGYVIVNSVSWSVTNEVEEELDISSNEEALPSLLEDRTSIWKQSYPASVYKEDGEVKGRQGPGRSKQVTSPSRMFSYKKESGHEKGISPYPPSALHEHLARVARFLAHYHGWGFLTTLSVQDKMQGVPFGHFTAFSDGPTDNSTGIPFFYMSSKGAAVTDLMKNPTVSLTLPEAEYDYCRKNVIEFEDPRCAQLILVGQMVAVPPEEMEFAKQAVFSRHPVMRRWPQSYEWFFMKMNIEHVCLQNRYGGVSFIAKDDYYKAAPAKA
ncbi:protein CREG2 [Microcaecilia unicolor]|uniref:Protein CREG2 n=1 Tax=Microcaecilia unicolor TaxID=1415580 RepID=A0A6P7Y372_9AMPH|nr:protein CREG2 [Microcaecilia unicolor]